MQLVVLNTMLPLGSAPPYLPGMLNCFSADKKIKMMRSISPVVGALAQPLILPSEIHCLKVLMLDKLLLLTAMARKLFKCFCDKWRGKLCGRQGAWSTLSSGSSLPFSRTTSTSKARKFH